MVLPLVPVTPITSMPAVGSPYTRAASRPSSARGRSATSTGSPDPPASSAPAGSVNTAAAPAAAAAAANRAPCVRDPGSAASRSPGRIAAESWVTPVTVASAAGAASPSAVASSVSRCAVGRLGRGGGVPDTGGNPSPR